ncbi:LysR substrate-binding domain-containing protein [Candidimonas sp. SYP-B2681]|uniref:LysR substrate-binding domain-containing protein n=1 Tax=Candidimonas sp. SYP-B2681 TaxID=2497686 RepID=UPI00131557E9|nr:LysR substrate-binding domain-containing protein [Candidimonas sp. SYP-B2681]
MSLIPPLHLILAFDAVARIGSFNKAADELSISSSSISHRIRELERFVGVSLFERTTRFVGLTGDGARLHQMIKKPLNALESAFAEITPKRSVVRISALPSFARFRLVPGMRQFRIDNPDIFIEVSPTTRKVNVDQGDADIALRFTATTPTAHHCEPLLMDEWFPVAAPEYLRQLGNPSLSGLFKTADFLSHSRQPWDQWLNAAGMKISPAQRNFTYSDTGFMLDAALSLQGVALVRRSLVKGLLADGVLERVSDISIPSDQSYFMLASERALVSRHGANVMEWIRSLVKDG